MTRPPPDIIPMEIVGRMPAGPVPGGSMLYSVPGKAGYTYYAGPGSFPATGRYRAPRGRPVHGMFTVEQFCPELPGGVRQVGQGPLPRGIICDPGGGMLSGIPEGVKRFSIDVAAALFAKWLIFKIWK